MLFADMTGSTSLEEELDPERVRALVDRFYAALRAEVEKSGGRVVKFTGDGLMAAFGVPEVHEDDALRAIEAATAMCTACSELATQTGFTSVSLKVGVNTGEVVVIEDDDDVVGDTVNVASRLEGAARAGEVLVGEETWRLTRSTSRYEPIEPLTLKGKSEPVPAYRLLAVSDGVADTLAAPFVGRERELDVLLAAFDQAVASNSARLVTVIASPGLGKTRLTRELADRLAGRAVVRETRCNPTSATFAPIAEALREANDIPESAGEEEVLAGLLARIPSDEPDRQRIAALAAAVLGAAKPGSTEETFWALRRMIETAAARDLPRVLVLEDLHWAEPLLLDLVEHLAEWIREGPVLLIGTARPELREMRASLVEGGRADAVIALEGLDRRATERLAVGLLDSEEVPSELLARIPESTEGNPLFVREFVRMLVDDGILQRTSSGWNVSVDVDAIQVPPTIQSLLAARVDRLRPDERTVIELAAVVGKEFYRGALDELAPPAVRQQVDSALESLRRKELVEPAGMYWIDEPVYRFHHALIRDAAYRRLLKETRADVHERMAGWLERKTAGVLGEHEELIGFHLEQAHEYKAQLGSRDDALGIRAAKLLGEAAQRALDRDDLMAASSLSGRALVRLPLDHLERSRLLVIRCEALLSMGDVVGGADAVRDLEDISDTARLRAWGACFSGQLASLIAPERLQEIEKRVSAAAVELAGLGDPAGAAKAHTVHGATLARLGRFAECESALDAALTAAREANDRRRITAVLESAPLAALWGPNPVSRAGGRCLDLVRLSRITTGSPGVEVTSTRCQAVLEAFRGRADAARRMLRNARRTLNELGLKLELLETEQFAGIVELVAGDSAAALPHLREAHAGFHSGGVDVSAAQTAALLARAHLRLGEVDEAEAFANECEELCGQDLKASIAWRAVRAELLAHRGEFDEARGLAESAVELASRTDALIDHGDACSALATVCAAAGDTAAARSASERAFALYERKGATTLIGSATAPIVVAPSSSAQPIDLLDNEAVRVFSGISASFEAQDWDRFGSLLDEHAVFDDSRPIMRSSVRGRDAIVAIGRSIADSGVYSCPFTIVATRGRRLLLARTMLRGRELGTTAFETEVLAIIGLSAHDLIDIWMPVDSQDMPAAFAALDDRYLATVEPSSLERAGIEFVRSHNRQEWDRFAEIAGAKAVMDLAADKQLFWLGTLAANDHGCVALCRVEGAPAAPVENRFIVCIEGDAERLARIEVFAEESRDAALARFEELASAARPPENECVRALRAFLSTFEARDWEALAEHHRSDFAMYDRRLGLGMTYRGRDTQVEVLKGTADVGTTNAELTPLAIRGSKLSLVSTVWRGPTDTAFGSEFLAVSEIDDDGRIAEIVVFSVDDLDAAIQELDDRFSADEGAEHIVSQLANSATVLGERHNAAFEARDWSVYEGQLADDVSFEDHRKGFGLTLAGRDAYMQVTKGAADVATRFLLSTVAIRGELLTLDRMTATGRGGPAELETEFLSVKEWDSSGRLVRMINFDPSDLDPAFRELDERFIAGEGAQRSALVRLSGKVLKAMNERDWPGLRAVFADDLVFVDHRPTSLARSLGGDRRVDELRALLELLDDYHCHVAEFHRIEDPFVLGHFAVEGRTTDGSEVEISYQMVVEMRDDVCARMEIFPIDGLEEALERFHELRGPSGHEQTPRQNSASRVLRLALDRMLAQDWDGVASLCAPDIEWEDTRQGLQSSTKGRDASIEHARVMDVGVRSWNFREVATRGDRLALFHTAIDVVGAFQIELYVLCEVDPSGLITHSSFYGSDDLHQALNRLDSRFAADEATQIASTANRCSWLFIEFHEHLGRSDFERTSAMYADDITIDDRRSGLANVISGKSAACEQLRLFMDEVPGTQVDSTVRATRGEHLALLETVWHISDTGFDVGLLTVAEVDDSDRFVTLVQFESSQVEAAIAELEERFIAGEGAGAADALRVVGALARELNDHPVDWDAIRELFADDLSFEDHRPASLGRMAGPDGWIESAKALAAITRLHTTIRTYHRLSADAIACRATNHLPRPDGAVFEATMDMVFAVRDGAISSWDVYPLDALDAALGRFDELAGVISGVDVTLSNAASRLMDRLVMLDDPVWETILAEGFVVEDRRLGLAAATRGVDAWAEIHRTIRDLGLRSVLPHEVVAVRGQRLALLRGSMSDNDDNTIDVLLIAGTDELGRLDALIFFDPDALDSAFVELDERFITGEGAPYADLLRRSSDQRDALGRGDWTTYRALIADDVVLVDNRPASLGEIRGVDAVIEAVRTLAPLVSGVRPRATAVHRLAADRLLVRVTAVGTDVHGGAVEMTHLRIQQFRGRRVVRIELFPIDRYDDAVERFEELRPEQSVGELENAATRAYAECLEAFTATDWDRMRDLLSDDLVSDDRRRSVASQGLGADAYVNSFQAIRDLGFRRASSEVLATRGDRLGLTKWDLADAGGNEIVGLAITELARDGRTRALVWFDADAHDAAFLELDERYRAGEGKAYADQIAFGVGVFRSINERDWTTFRSLLADDLVLIDHRPASLGELVGADAEVEALRTLVDVVPSVRFYVSSVHALRSNACIIEVSGHGQTPQGDMIDLGFLALYMFEDKLTRIEMFEPGEVQAALARLGELTAQI